MNTPKVSVILPVYNGENYLRSAIESVLGQTFRDLELIIVDDGSTDSTQKIASEYSSRLRYVRQDNTGVAGAFNHGLSLAAGQFISWLSHDDVFLPEKLERQVAALSCEPRPAVCYTDVQMIGPAGEVLAEHRLPEYPRGQALRHVLIGADIGMASYSICYDRRCIEEVGNYSVHWRYTQDADMLMRFALRFPMIRVPEVLMQVREHVARGIHTSEWMQEAIAFYRHQLNTIPLDALFTELVNGSSRKERADALVWLADAFAARTFPLHRLAYYQYLRALRANPVDAKRLLRRIAGLYWRRRKESRR